MSGISFPLSKPIKAHGKEIETLELAEPGTKDVRELGYPFSATPGANGDADLKLFPEVGARYISRLAKIPMSSVDQMEPGDFLMLHTELCGFFGRGSAGSNSKSESSISPGSGE
jgi:hypothetical protein